MKAFIPNLNVPSKIKVERKFLPKELYGDYCVAEIDENYSYAIVSGDQLTVEGSDGLCNTESGENEKSQGGLWLFMREPEVSEEVVDEMKKKTRDLSIDTSKLKQVE